MESKVGSASTPTIYNGRAYIGCGGTEAYGPYSGHKMCIRDRQESPYGYSVHYATIATMMLRYYGIPARYCEGYYVSGDEAATYAAGQTVTFTEAKSHAWTEYYLAGVGWLPFEVTPGYVDKEELEGEGLGGGGRTYICLLYTSRCV